MKKIVSVRKGYGTASVRWCISYLPQAHGGSGLKTDDDDRSGRPSTAVHDEDVAVI